MLSDLGTTFPKTHELGALMEFLARSGAPLPTRPPPMPDFRGLVPNQAALGFSSSRMMRRSVSSNLGDFPSR